MTLISRTTLTGTAASVTFSSIPQTYQTLKLVVSARGSDSVAVWLYINFNSSSTGFTSRLLAGSGSAASSTTLTYHSSNYVPSGYTASTFSNAEITIPNYTGSANKAWSSDSVNENNATATDMSLLAGLWSNTAAITSITLVPQTVNIVANSTFSLYGVS